MKKIILILALLLIPLAAEARMGAVMMGGGVAAGASCTGPYEYSSDTTTPVPVGDITNHTYVGNTYSYASNREICRIDVVITLQGSVSGYTYLLKIWSLSGNNLDTALGTSSAVSGSTMPGTIAFTFATPVSLTASTTYAITLESDTIDASNYAKLRGSASSAYTGNIRWWNGSKAYVDGYANIDCAMSFYNFQ